MGHGFHSCAKVPEDTYCGKIQWAHGEQNFPHDQWPFQEPKLEVPTIYFRPMF